MQAQNPDFRHNCKSVAHIYCEAGTLNLVLESLNHALVHSPYLACANSEDFGVFVHTHRLI